jgi:adenylate kinase family enzyme
MTPLQAMLLIGPTGSGKTPLGDWFETHGLCGRCCHHFDFGACLRRIASEETSGPFDASELHYIQDVVQKGLLLDNETFYIALRILEAFIKIRRIEPRHLLIMNGLPRHVGQADALAGHIECIAVIHLNCTAQVVWERLRLNSGGDRAQRMDDTLELVERKLAIFEKRTEPLLAYYHARGVPAIVFDMDIATQPAEIGISIGDSPHLRKYCRQKREGAEGTITI